MMKLIRKILQIDETSTSPEDEARIRDAEQELLHARGELRQKVQVYDSGTRLMVQWAGANAMVRGKSFGEDSR